MLLLNGLREMVRAGATDTWRGGSAAGAGAMERNVARLFRERVALFGEVHFTQASVLAGAQPWLTPHVGLASQGGGVCVARSLKVKTMLSFSEADKQTGV